MFNFNWSLSEKKIARQAYDEALKAAAAKSLVEFKRRANAAGSLEDLWAVETWLREQRRERFEMFDYRYSQLPAVFGWAIREGYLDEQHLAGLSEDKMKLIRSLATFTVSEH